MNKKILYLLLFIFICTFIYSLINIIKWYIDVKNTNNVIEDIKDIIVINDIENKDNKFMDIDITKLKDTNSDTVGWIKISGTNIDYPFVKTSNNDYYLTHSFDKSYNNAGWVFMDYRNKIDFSDDNTILYAHGRLDKTMFGSLKDTLDKEWFNNLDNRIIKISTENENSLWEVFSIYKIPTTDDYITINFDDIEYNKFIDMIKKRSVHNFNVNVSNNDKILTLSTCYNNSDKVVLHAKLIEKESK